MMDGVIERATQYLADCKRFQADDIKQAVIIRDLLAEIERLKEWKAKVLDAANCDGEEQKRSQVYYQDIAYAVWPNAEVQDKAAELKASAERAADDEIERLRAVADQRRDELDSMRVEVERLRESLKCIAVGMIREDWVAGPRLSAIMAVGRLSQIARDALNQPRREEQQ